MGFVVFLCGGAWHKHNTDSIQPDGLISCIRLCGFCLSVGLSACAGVSVGGCADVYSQTCTAPIRCVKNAGWKCLRLRQVRTVLCTQTGSGLSVRLCVCESLRVYERYQVCGIKMLSALWNIEWVRDFHRAEQYKQDTPVALPTLRVYSKDRENSCLFCFCLTLYMPEVLFKCRNGYRHWLLPYNELSLSELELYLHKTSHHRGRFIMRPIKKIPYVDQQFSCQCIKLFGKVLLQLHELTGTNCNLGVIHGPKDDVSVHICRIRV